MTRWMWGWILKLLGRFLVHFRTKLGGKLALKSEKMGHQDDVKKSSNIWRREWYGLVRQVVGLLAPKNNPNPGIPGIQGQYKTLETLPLGLKARGRI